MHAGGNTKRYSAGTRGEWWLETCAGNCGKSVNTCGDKSETMWMIGWVLYNGGYVCKECHETTKRVVRKIQETGSRRSVPNMSRPQMPSGNGGIGGGNGGTSGMGAGGNGGSGTITIAIAQGGQGGGGVGK